MMVQHYTNMSQIQKLNGQSHSVNGKFESSEKQKHLHLKVDSWGFNPTLESKVMERKNRPFSTMQ